MERKIASKQCSNYIFRYKRKCMENKLVLHSHVKQNQPRRCRFYKSDVVKHFASIL